MQATPAPTPAPTAATRRRIFVAAQVVAAAIVLFFVARQLVQQWSVFRSQPLDSEPRWALVAGSAVVVLLTYALLIETWRVMLRAWGASLSFGAAARIWCVSNLGRYVPGKIWQITAMGVMATQAGVSPIVSTGSAIVGTVVNIASGIALILILGWRWLDTMYADARGLAIALVVLAAAGLIALPFVAPALGRLVARVTGRESRIPAPPARIVAIALVGNVLAWALYGLAFMWFVKGIIGSVAGAPWQYVAVFTASYVVGYLFLFLPGGIGPREGVMAALLSSLQLTTLKQAWLIAGASRVWLTVLEILPGLVFLALNRSRTPSAKLPGNATSQ